MASDDNYSTSTGNPKGYSPVATARASRWTASSSARPGIEVETVRRIYHLFTQSQLPESHIAKALNNEGMTGEDAHGPAASCMRS